MELDSRLGLQMKHAARHQMGHGTLGEPTMPSIGSAIASDGMLSDTDRWRWAPRLPSPTSFENSQKRSCDSHQYIVRTKGACSEPGRQRASFSRRPYFRFSSFDRSDRKSASARFPANSAAISDWNPSPVILMPNALLLRHISQLQRSGYSPRREVMR